MRSISVIIPVYNSSGTIVRCLESIMAQSVPVEEVIVVDDASRDDTVAVLEKLAKAEPYASRLKILRHAKNQGPSRARNLAIKECRSELIALIDADDFWLSHHLETALAILEREGPATTSVVHRPLDERPASQAEGLRYHAFSVLRYLLIQANCSTITLVAPRQLVLQTPLFPTGRRYAEDFEFFIHLFRASKRRICVDNPRSAVVGKHAFAATTGLSSRTMRMYWGSLAALTFGLYRTPYLLLIPLLWLWHTIKLVRRAYITWRVRRQSARQANVCY